jgi:hypothetical protein
VFGRELFRARRDAPWIGYVPVLIVTGLFTLYGVHDEMPWHFLVLLVVCVLQLRYRTLAGWGLLFGLCVVYGFAVLAKPDRNALGEWVFFALCGVVPLRRCLCGVRALCLRSPNQPTNIWANREWDSFSRAETRIPKGAASAAEARRV